MTIKRHAIDGGLHVDLDVGGAQSAGDVVALSEMTVYCLTDTDDSDVATVVIPGATYAATLTVAGSDNAGDSAVSVGDRIYDDSGTYNKDATNGVALGFALGTVSGGETGDILVALMNA